MELTRRQSARTNLLDFARFTMPGYETGPQHVEIARAMEAVERGEIKRLLVMLAPRHGKSELVSRRFPAWYLGRNPDRQIISASYGQDLATDFGRDVRNIIQSSEYQALFGGTSIAQDSGAKHRWHTNKGGSYVAAGVGTAITGRGAHILNIDDPVKDRAEAESATIREAVWNWYTSTAYTRLMPGGAVVVTLTRWHESDLAGRLLEAAETGGDQWTVVKLPAVDAAGAALWPAKYNRADLDRIRAAIGERDWSALYQQDPRPPEGALFKIALMGVLEAPPLGAVQRIRRWDLAATRQVGTRDPDWTAGVLLAKQSDGRLVVEDVVRLRGGPDQVEATILATAQRDGVGVTVGLPKDPGQAGVSQVQYLTRLLAGFKVESERETGDKATRAAPFASQVNVGNVSMVRGAWNRPFLDELASFPSGTHDDQVDAASGAYASMNVPQSFAPFLVPFNLHRR